MRNDPLNQITGVLEAAAFVLVVLAFVVLWFVTPAHAGQTCYAFNTNNGTVVNCY